MSLMNPHIIMARCWTGTWYPVHLVLLLSSVVIQIRDALWVCVLLPLIILYASPVFRGMRACIRMTNCLAASATSGIRRVKSTLINAQCTNCGLKNLLTSGTTDSIYIPSYLSRSHLCSLIGFIDPETRDRFLCWCFATRQRQVYGECCATYQVVSSCKCQNWAYPSRNGILILSFLHCVQCTNTLVYFVLLYCIIFHIHTCSSWHSNSVFY